MSAANFFIPALPGQPADSTLTMYGGHIPSAPVRNGVKDVESDAHLYFFMVRNRHIAETERTLLWCVFLLLSHLPPLPAVLSRQRKGLMDTVAVDAGSTEDQDALLSMAE
jgi:hypothetical protein